MPLKTGGVDPPGNRRCESPGLQRSTREGSLLGRGLYGRGRGPGHEGHSEPERGPFAGGPRSVAQPNLGGHTFSSCHSAIRAPSHGEAGCHTTSNQGDLSPKKLHASISQIDYPHLPCRLEGFVGLIQIGGINKLSASVEIGSGASVNMAKDMHLGSLLSYGFEQLFAAQMGSVRSCLIEDSIRRTMRHEYIEGIWNAVPMHICFFTAGIHKSPVKECGSIG
jgi:hypothetical protein